MPRFTVVPDTLRRTAATLDVELQDAEREIAVPESRFLGHAALAAALADFLSAVTGGWTEAIAQAEAVASGLRATAAIYERADAAADDVVKSVRALL